MIEEMTLEDELKAVISGGEPEEVDDDKGGAVEETPVVENPSETVVSESDSKLEPAKIDAPVALSGAIKAKWNELPEDVRNEWKKREDDIHRMMTAKDGELNLGRSIKEIAAPYEAIIRSEGGTVEGAFKDLLNTSYILRAGSPLQKAQAVMQTVQQFNIDLSPYFGQQGQQQQTPNNALIAMQKEIDHLRQQADPNKIRSQLQEDQDRVRINAEVQAFAANPQNVHFEAVKPAMGALLQSGRAKDLQEAYDQAIWSDPSIRSELMKAQKAQEDQQRKAEMASKKKAAASVAGSPGMASPNANAPKKSIEEEIRAAMGESSGKI